MDKVVIDRLYPILNTHNGDFIQSVREDLEYVLEEKVSDENVLELLNQDDRIEKEQLEENGYFGWYNTSVGLHVRPFSNILVEIVDFEEELKNARHPHGDENLVQSYFEIVFASSHFYVEDSGRTMDIKTREKIIEFKNINHIDKGIGQLLDYAYYFPTTKRQLIVFGSPFKKQQKHNVLDRGRWCCEQAGIELFVAEDLMIQYSNPARLECFLKLFKPIYDCIKIEPDSLSFRIRSGQNLKMKYDEPPSYETFSRFVNETIRNLLPKELEHIRYGVDPFLTLFEERRLLKKPFYDETQPDPEADYISFLERVLSEKYIKYILGFTSEIEMEADAEFYRSVLYVDCFNNMEDSETKQMFLKQGFYTLADIVATCIFIKHRKGQKLTENHFDRCRKSFCICKKPPKCIYTEDGERLQLVRSPNAAKSIHTMKLRPSKLPQNTPQINL
jgi:hypothetical protein